MDVAGEKRWSYFEEARLCYLLLDLQAEFDINDETVLLSQLPGLGSSIFADAPREDPFSPEDIAVQIRHMLERVREFRRWTRRPGVHYDEEINAVTITPVYMTSLPHEPEPMQYRVWRARGEPNLHCVELLIGAMAAVDFDWLQINAAELE